MKKFIMVILIIALVISGILIFKYINKDKFYYRIETISEYKYYIYKDNGKSGVIDSDGKTIIEPNYTKVIIPNPRERYIYLL